MKCTLTIVYNQIIMQTVPLYMNNLQFQLSLQLRPGSLLSPLGSLLSQLHNDDFKL